jgi:hypothetical protein
LTAHLASCQPQIEQALRETMSAQVRARLESILAAARRPLTDDQRREQQIRRNLRMISRWAE